MEGVVGAACAEDEQGEIGTEEAGPGDVGEEWEGGAGGWTWWHR